MSFDKFAELRNHHYNKDTVLSPLKNSLMLFLFSQSFPCPQSLVTTINSEFFKSMYLLAPFTEMA